MRIWVEDLKYHVAMAMRAVGLGVVVVAWASALASEAQQVSDLRSYAEVAAAVVTVLAIQALTLLPPSARVVDLLKALERDITAVARERSSGDKSRAEDWSERIREQAARRIRAGANVPRDRRRWLRALSRLAEVDEAGHQFEMNQAGGGQA